MDNDSTRRFFIHASDTYYFQVTFQYGAYLESEVGAERPTPGGHHIEHGAANGAKDNLTLNPKCVPRHVVNEVTNLVDQRVTGRQSISISVMVSI